MMSSQNTDPSPQERLPFAKANIVKAATDYILNKVMPFRFQIPEYNGYNSQGDRLIAIKKEYLRLMKLKRDEKILQQAQVSKENNEYLERLTSIVDVNRILEEAMISNNDIMSLKKVDAERIGLIKPAIQIHISDEADSVSSKNPAPIFLDDSVMNYKYLYDSNMPDCFERSLKKLRCLLRFYILLIQQNVPLIQETWEAMRKMNLVQEEAQIISAIKAAFDETFKAVPKNMDQYLVDQIKKSGNKIKEHEENGTSIEKDRTQQAKDAQYYEGHELNSAFKFLNGVLDKIVSFNFQQFFFLLDASKTQIPDFQKIDELILLLGRTGVGKSTTIQFMSGIDMVQIGKHIQGNPDQMKQFPELAKIQCAESAESVTRYCQAIMIKHNEKVIGILDTPGRGDTKNAEVDISNQLSIVRVIKACQKRIYPMLLFSQKDVGGRGQNLRNDIINYSSIIKNVEANIKGFSYFFTHFNEAIGNQETLVQLVRRVKNTFDDDDKLDFQVLENVQFVAADMVRKANNEKLVAVNPLDKIQRGKILDDVFASGGVDYQKDFLAINAERQSVDKMIMQVQWHQRGIVDDIKEGNIMMAIYKLDELKRLQEELGQQSGVQTIEKQDQLIVSTFDLFINKMIKRINETLDDIKTGLSRHNLLQESSINNFRQSLQQLKNLDKIKSFGYSDYIKVDTASQILEKVQKDVNDVVKNLKNVSIGDIQWLQFLEKIFRLCKAFPEEFSSLKASAIKQYLEQATNVIAQYEKIFHDQEMLQNFQKKNQKAAPGGLMRQNSAAATTRASSIEDIFGTTKIKKSKITFAQGSSSKISADSGPSRENILGRLILQKIQNTHGISDPPHVIFERCIKVLAEARKNLSESIKSNPEYSSLYDELLKYVKDLIDSISDSITDDIKEKVADHIQVLINYDASSMRSLQGKKVGIQGEQDVKFLQASFDLIENFAQIAEKHQIEEIRSTLDNILQQMIKIAKDLFVKHFKEIQKQLSQQQSDDEIMDSSYFKWRYGQLVYLREIHQVCDETTTDFQTLQAEIQRTVQMHRSKIRINLLKLQRGNERFHEGVEEDLVFEELDHSAQVIRYFGGLLEPDDETMNQIRNQLKVELEKILRNFDTQADVKQMNHPRNWKNIENVGHVMEEYRHISRVIAALEIKIDQEGGLASRIGAEVGQALNVIKQALEQHVFFMTSKDYTEWGKYFMYLHLVIKESEVYLPSQELKDLAKNLFENLQDLVMKQYSQLQSVFNYRFYRYMFKQNKESKWQYVPRPAPLFYKIGEEIKDPQSAQQEEQFDSSKWEVAEDADWRVRVKVASQDIFKILTTVSWLINKQISGTMNLNDNPLSLLLRPLLEKEDIWELFGDLRKALLSTYFDGLTNLQELWMIHQTEKEDSVFLYRQTVLQQLKIVDINLSLRDLDKNIKLQIEAENDHSGIQYFSKSSEDNEQGLQRIANESLAYQSLEDALNDMLNQTKFDPNEKVNEAKKLYNSRQYQEVAAKLAGELKIMPDAMKAYIQADVDNTVAKVLEKVDELKAPKSSADSDQQYGDDSDGIESIIKVVAQEVLKLDIVLDVLGAYMNKEGAQKSLESIMTEIKNSFTQILDGIKNQGENGDTAGALVRFHETSQLILKIQRNAKDTSAYNNIAPQTLSLPKQAQEILVYAGTVKHAIEGSFKAKLEQFNAAEIETGFSEDTLYPKSLIDPLASLTTQIKGQTINNNVVDYIGNTIKRYETALSPLRPEEAKNEEQLNKLLAAIGVYRKSVNCQPKEVSSKVGGIIDHISRASDRRKEELTVLVGKKILVEAFEKPTPDEIAAILDDPSIKPLIKDEILIQVQDKFVNKISNILKEALKKFGSQDFKQLIDVDIPFIEGFLDHLSLKTYILPTCTQQFKSLIKDPLRQVALYALLFIAKQVVSPKDPIDLMDPELIAARNKMSIQVGSIKQALKVVGSILGSDSKGSNIDGFQESIQQLYNKGARWMSDTVTLWKKAIVAKSTQAMIPLIDELALNEKFFRSQDFTTSLQIDYKSETDTNYEFVRAFNNVLNAKDHKKALNDWGEEQKEKVAGFDFKKKNERSNKHERTTFYSNIDVIIQELSSVATKTDEYSFFNYEDKSLMDIRREIIKLLAVKVDELIQLLTRQMENTFLIQETLNLLGQKNAEKYNPVLQSLNESYNNLETLREALTSVDVRKKKEINDCLEAFKQQLLSEEKGRVKWLSDKARSLYAGMPAAAIKSEHLQEVSKILIEMQLLKKNLLKFKDDLQDRQDKILDDYDRIQLQRKNKARLDNLRKLIQGQDSGSALIAECRAFEGDNMKELAKKLATKGVDDVLKQMTGDDIIFENEIISQRDNIAGTGGSQGKQWLKSMFDKFNLRYQELIRRETMAQYDDEGKIKPISTQNIIGAIRNFKLSKRKWLDSDIDKLPELLSLIFGLWSLQKPDHLKKKQEDRKAGGPGDEDAKDEGDLLSYLNQPHPAQVLGIMRIMGVGYNPDEYKKYSPEEQWKSQMFGSSADALKSRIRNNLVQIKTGEGKSVTLAVLSIIFALCDFDVRCACYSVYLSKRDYKAFENMFNQLGLKDFIKYSTFNEICEMEINRNGELRDIVLNLILENPENKIQIKRDADPRPQVLLIDEVDVFFSDDFFGKTYQPQAQIKGPAITALTDYIWENRDRQMKIQDLEKTDVYREAQALFHRDYVFLLKEAVKAMIVDIIDIENYKLGTLLDGRIQYKVGDSWSDKAVDGYKTLFAYYFYYYRDCQAPGRESITLDTLSNKKAIGINCAKFSYAEGPLSFALILGLTGTLDTLSPEQQKIMKVVYNLQSKTYAPSAYDIPPELKRPEDRIDGLVEEVLIMNEFLEELHKGKTNTDEIHYINEMSIKILKTKEDWFRFIASRIGEGLETKNTKNKECQRAVVVFFANDVILNEFKLSEFFGPYDGPKADTLTEKNDNDEKTSKVSNATNQGQVTLLTREFGRGTDFKYQGDLVINAGGLHVIQTFFTNDYSEEIQIRGRTRRQGTRGSYEMCVYQEDLFKLMDQAFIDEMIANISDPEKRYKHLHKKRQEMFMEAQNKKLETRNVLKPIHYEYAGHVENIKKSIEGKNVGDAEKEGIKKMLQVLNNCDKYAVMIPQEKLVKVLVLIDATGSMGALLENAKNSIKLYFETVCETLKKNDYKSSIFKLQMAFYRNYTSGPKILQHSDWTGPDDIEELKAYLENVKAEGGQGCEAVEIGLLHANREIYEPEDGIPVSLIFVIGDAPGNANLEVVKMKRAYGSTKKNSIDEYANQKLSQDQANKLFIPHKLFTEVEQEKYGKPTYWDEQLKRIDNFEDEGVKIPIYSFYLVSQLFQDRLDQVASFFTKIRINNEDGDEGGLLDVNDKNKLVELFCRYTMRMIAKKNSSSGNAAGLILAAQGLSFA